MHKNLWAISNKLREKEIGRCVREREFCKSQPVDTVLRALPLGELKPLGHPEDQWRSCEGLFQLKVIPNLRPSP